MGATAKPMTDLKVITWETIESSGGRGHLAIRRAKVPGGWLVYASDGYHSHGGLTFLPDPSHQWDGCSLPDGAE